MKQMFEALMVGPTRSSGGGGSSRSSRALLRAKARAVVTPDEREAMEDIVREELVSSLWTCGGNEAAIACTFTESAAPSAMPPL